LLDEIYKKHNVATAHVANQPPISTLYGIQVLDRRATGGLVDVDVGVGVGSDGDGLVVVSARADGAAVVGDSLLFVVDLVAVAGVRCRKPAPDANVVDDDEAVEVVVTGVDDDDDVDAGDGDDEGEAVDVVAVFGSVSIEDGVNTAAIATAAAALNNGNDGNTKRNSLWGNNE
jgi:hypothetical protein